MYTIIDIFYVRANKEDETKIKLKSGLELYIDPDINKYHHAVQSGVITHVPKRISDTLVYDVELKVGDIVYFHHFIVQDDNYNIIDGEKLYRCSYNNMYAVVRKGKIIPIQKEVLMQPILEAEENYKTKSGLFTKPAPEQLKDRGKITHLSKTGIKKGLKVGDVAFFERDANYEMKIEGEPYWRMSADNIIAVLVN